MGAKLCAVAGCLNVTHGSRCALHEAEHQRRRNAQPKRRAYKDPAYTSVPLVGSCACCGATEDLTRDHVVPLATRGPVMRVGVDAFVILCRRCNGSKGGRMLVDARCPLHGGLVWEGPRG